MDRVDVLVVGAGPAGSTAAYHLAKKGWSVMLWEEHPLVGRPVQCAGLVSQRVIDMAQSSKMVSHQLGGATIWSPSMKMLRFKANDSRALVISREKLDFHLAERAASAGVRIETACKFTDLQRGAGEKGKHVTARATTSNGKLSVEARVIIGADGVSSAVARGLRLRRPLEILPAFETEIPYKDAPQDEVEVYLGNALAPGLFGWSIPDGEGNLRVGVAMKARYGMTARDGYGALVHQMEKRYSKRLPPPIRSIVSGIPIGLVPRISTEHGLIVGDAAAQVKPLSGGGIFTGMRAAEIASEVVSSALSSGDLSAEKLSQYDLKWARELGTEMERALFFRRIFVQLSDKDLDRVVEALKDSSLVSTIVAFGDIDFPTVTIRELLRQSPVLIRLFPKALSAFLRMNRGLVPDVLGEAR